LTDYIKNRGVKFWFFGHSHGNINAKIGNTYYICNQIGYVSSNEHETFNNEKNIDPNTTNFKLNGKKIESNKTKNCEYKIY